METPKVYAAIAAVTAELAKDGIGKDRKNQQQGYSFRGIDDVYNAIAPILSRNGVVVLPRYYDREVTERKTERGGLLFNVVLRAEYDFVAVEDASTHKVQTFGEAMDTADKATNKAMSAAFKYALMQVFTIPTEGDNDADAVTHKVLAQESADMVAKEKIAALSAAKDTSKPAKAKVPSGVSFKMLETFSALKKELGEELYYRILGANGYAKSTEILDAEIGRRIYKELAAAANDLKIAQQEAALGSGEGSNE